MKYPKRSNKQNAITKRSKNITSMRKLLVTSLPWQIKDANDDWIGNTSLQSNLFTPGWCRRPAFSRQISVLSIDVERAVSNVWDAKQRFSINDRVYTCIRHVCKTNENVPCTGQERRKRKREREREEKRERGKVRWRDETGRLAYNRGVDIENLSEAE